MPLGSNKFQNKNVQLGNGPGKPIPELLFNITEVYSGNSSVDVTTDATTITYQITSDVLNTTVGFAFSGNIASGDFSDGILSGNIVTDSNGNATITKTVTASGGHKDFVMNLVRPEFPNIVLQSSNVTNLYEVLPINITGGDSTETTNVVIADYNSSDVLVSHRIHKFTSTGSANLTITNYGNYEGNSNIWYDQYKPDSEHSYWQGSNIAIRSLTIGGGGAGAGSGAGELGVLHYPLSNVSTGVYTMTVGGSQANSTAFAGNATLSRTSLAGGNSNGGNGGSGGGGDSGSGPGHPLLFFQAETDLAFNAGNVAFPNNFKEFVYTAAGSKGGTGFFGTLVDGGGGAFGIGGRFDNGASSPYGHNIKKGQNFDDGKGGNGISWANNRNYPQTSIGISQNGYPHRWYENPLYNGTNTVTDIAGGRGGSGGDDNSDGVGAGGFGGGTQAGVVTISYPYRPAYRFITAQDLS